MYNRITVGVRLRFEIRELFKYKALNIIFGRKVNHINYQLHDNKNGGKKVRKKHHGVILAGFKIKTAIKCDQHYIIKSNPLDKPGYFALSATSISI